MHDGMYYNGNKIVKQYVFVLIINIFKNLKIM